jgi:dihydroflavonol-4-reductase
MGQAIISLYRGKLPALIPGGFDWVDVRDVVQGAIQAAKRGRTGERYLLSGTWVTMREMAEIIAQISGIPKPKFTAPFWLARLGIPFIKIYSRLNNTSSLYTGESLSTLKHANKHISSQKAVAALDFQVRPLEETLRDTFAWYKEAGMLV